MRVVSLSCFILFTILSSVSALSITLEPLLIVGDALEGRNVDWPSAAGGHAAKRGGAPTNGELLRRTGLPPNPRPRKLYDGNTRLEPRIDNPAPPTAMASQAPGGVYNFVGCFDAVVAISSISTANAKNYRFSYTSDADAANQCAGKQDVDAPGGTIFIITFSSTNAECYTSVMSDVGTPETCRMRSYARYTGN